MKKAAVVLISAGVLFICTASPSRAEQAPRQKMQEPGEAGSEAGGENRTSIPDKKTDAKEEELFAKGMGFYESGNHPEAIAIFEQIIDINPDNAEAGEHLLLSIRETITAGDIRDELFLRGLEQFLRKEYKDAAELFQLVLEMNPNHGKAIKYLAKAEEGLKQVQAEEELRRARREKERRQQEEAAARSAEAAAHRALRRDIGPYLVNSEGRRISSDMLLAKKYALLYFSASWCPPCRAYTPRLVEFYEKHSGKDIFEVIFVSSDRSSGEMFKYMKDYRMTWSALSYERAAQKTLSRKYNVTGIPRLIALDAGGTVIMDSARIDRNRMLDELARRFQQR